MILFNDARLRSSLLSRFPTNLTFGFAVWFMIVSYSQTPQYLVDGAVLCSCTTFECRRDSTAVCKAETFCYAQIIPTGRSVNRTQPSASSTAATAVDDGGYGNAGKVASSVEDDVVRGCIDDRTPLLCENRRPSTYVGTWPVLLCCREAWCNREVIPTMPSWATNLNDTRNSTQVRVAERKRHSFAISEFVVNGNRQTTSLPLPKEVHTVYVEHPKSSPDLSNDKSDVDYTAEDDYSSYYDYDNDDDDDADHRLPFPVKSDRGRIQPELDIAKQRPFHDINKPKIMRSSTERNDSKTSASAPFPINPLYIAVPLSVAVVLLAAFGALAAVFCLRWMVKCRSKMCQRYHGTLKAGKNLSLDLEKNGNAEVLPCRWSASASDPDLRYTELQSTLTPQALLSETFVDADESCINHSADRDRYSVAVVRQLCHQDNYSFPVHSRPAAATEQFAPSKASTNGRYPTPEYAEISDVTKLSSPSHQQSDLLQSSGDSFVRDTCPTLTPLLQRNELSSFTPIYPAVRNTQEQ